MVTELKILGTRVDLFGDENIEVINSVLDIKDISKNTNAFTRGFTVPASATNNQIFKHYYDADINNSFDARTKVAAEILLDGIPFQVGFVQLTKVNIKKNKPSSYSVNFSGNLSGISKAAGDLKLKDLDLTAYRHSYNSTIVKSGLTSWVSAGIDTDGNATVIPATDLIYNTIVKKQYFYQPDGTNTSTDTLQNIAYDGGNLSGIIWNDLKPSLKLIVLIEAIEALPSFVAEGITFSRHFFDTTEFQELYMWLNPSKKKEIEGNVQRIDWTSQQAGAVWMNLTTDIGAYPCNSDTNDYTTLLLKVTPTNLNIEYNLKVYVENEVFFEGDFTGIFQNGLLGGSSAPWLIESDGGAQTKNVYFEITASQEFTFDAVLSQSLDTQSGNWYETYATANVIASEFVPSDNMPDLKIIDFLKGLFSMYKLIVLPLDDGTYKIIELDAYYAEGTSYDITKYIDFENWDVNRGKIFSEISFTFQDPTTKGNIFYKQTNDRGFGDEELIIREDMADDTSDQLDGESFVVKLPFEQVIFERISDTLDGEFSNLTYGAIIDESNEPVNPKPVIFYNQNFNGNDKIIGYYNDVGAKEQLTNYNNPVHGNSLTVPMYTTTFSAESNIWNFTRLTQNLYTNHYENYITDSFNIKKREYKYKAYLPLNIVTKLNLNDLLIIKGSFYRIIKWSYNIITGEADFELINYFGAVAPSQLKYSNQVINTDYTAKTISVYVFNLDGATYNKVDLSGDGTAWVSEAEDVATETGILDLTFTESSGIKRTRSMNLEITNNGYTITILIRQTPKTIFLTVDSTVVTVDNNIITSDNNI